MKIVSSIQINIFKLKKNALIYNPSLSKKKKKPTYQEIGIKYSFWRNISLCEAGAWFYPLKILIQ